MLLSWWRKLAQQSKSGTSRRPRSAGCRLGLEYLEDRTVPAFLAPVNYAAGISPTALAVGDFNGDGRQDIVTVNSIAVGSVSVLLGNGDGSFQAAVSSAAGANPTQLAVADFNGDGKLDVAVGGYNTLEVLTGNGDGTFQAPVLNPVGGVATHVSAGDFNGDGHPDLVMSTQVYGGTAMVLLNHGDGTFAPPINLAAGNGAEDVEVADFNHDGKQDLVIANYGSAEIIVGNGDGSFQSARPYAAGYAPYRVAIGDFNHDGNLDLAALNAFSSTPMHVLTGNGDGTFNPPASFNLPAAPNDVQTADFNGDGNLDLIEPTGTGYQVQMGRGDGSFYASTTYSASNASHNAVGDFNGDGVPDVAASSAAGTVTVLVNDNNAAGSLAGATGFQFTTPATAVAGQPFSVTVTAIDANGNPATGFTGTIAIAGGSQALAQPLSYTFTAADAGTHTFTNALALTAVGVQTITVTTPFLPAATQSVTVTAATATHFAVSAPAIAGAGASFAFTVTALDAYGNAATGYSGTMAFSSSDAQAGLPAAYTFTTADAGVQTFTATFKTMGSQTLTAKDAIASTIAGTSAAVVVTPGVASSLSLTGGGGFIGSAHTVTVTARDIFGNTATGYSGSAHLVSSDAATVVSGDVALVNGVGSVQVTPMKVGAETLTATDAAGSLVTGTETIAVTPGWAVRFAATPLAATTAGVAQNFTVTAYDAFGNVSNVYTGYVLVATTDPRLGSYYYALTAADAGVHTFSIALLTAGSQSVTVSDYGNASVKVTQTGIAVTAAAAASITVTPLQGGTAGVAQTFTVTAHDAYGNVATGYRGTLAFSTTDKQISSPAYTFTAADAGVHTFSVTFKTSGGTTFGVQDVANAANLAFVYSQRDIQITPGALAGLAITAPSNATAGVAFTVKVSAVDAFGNAIAGYVGKVHFTGTAGVPADYTFTALDAGTHAFSVNWSALGTQVLGVADTANGTLKAQASVAVKAGATGGGGGTGGGKKP